jgi:hypothetical protein
VRKDSRQQTTDNKQQTTDSRPFLIAIHSVQTPTHGADKFIVIVLSVLCSTTRGNGGFVATYCKGIEHRDVVVIIPTSYTGIPDSNLIPETD